LILSIFSMIAPAGARPTENPTESATTAELRQTFRLSDRENHRDRNRRYPNRFCHGGSPGSPVLTSTSATDNFLNPSHKNF
jgi:hypothetical protein